MKATKTQASFYFGEGKAYTSLKTFREAYTLAKSYGDPSAAVVVHYAIATCLPAARYALKVYPCDFQHHFSSYPERTQEVRIDEFEAEKRAIAQRAMAERAAIERIHAEECPDYTKMGLTERVQAVKRFQQRVRQFLGDV
jgi:hypothetical protein